MERKTSILFFSVGVLLCHIDAFVPPATNVTLFCHNLQNTLHWDYSHHDSLKPQFKVHVKQNGILHQLLVDYPDLQCDLSAGHFILPDADYHVQVTALVGPNASAPAPLEDLIYSYFYASPANVQCSLDVPPINVTIQSGSKLKISFSHPSGLYSHKLPTKAKPKPSKFDYKVLSDNKTEFDFLCNTNVCEESIPVAPGQESYCVTVRGYWKKMLVHSPREYCSRSSSTGTSTGTSPGYQQPLYIVLGVVFSLVFFVLLLAFTYKRICGFSPMPLSLQNFSKTEPDSHSNSPLISDPGTSPVSPVSIVSHTPTAVKEPTDGSPKLSGSTPCAPRPGPAPEAYEAAPRWADEGREAEPGVREDTGATPVGTGGGRLEAGAREAEPGAREAEPVAREAEPGVREPEPGAAVQNAFGYEQRDWVVTAIAITPGDMVDAYHS